ncbi:MAG TPA: T9SS type A sorting domain-containing protein, partial [Saprospiraceae bacterium]|nr:T9SS type A sorting domain-containing protein [Saprospiraceae bacterium]
KDAVADLHISRNKSFDQNQLLIFPNPATEGVQIHINGLDNLIGNIIVYSSTGQRIKEVSGLSQKSYHLGLDELQTGLYIVQVKSTTGQLYNQKLKVVKP